MEHFNNKQVPCRFFLQGHCFRGTSCHFLHSSSSKSPSSSHSLTTSPSPSSSPLYNTPVCTYFRSPQGCRYGATCRFIHDDTLTNQRTTKKINNNDTDNDNDVFADPFQQPNLIFDDDDFNHYKNEYDMQTTTLSEQTTQYSQNEYYPICNCELRRFIPTEPQTNTQRSQKNRKKKLSYHKIALLLFTEAELLEKQLLISNYIIPEFGKNCISFRDTVSDATIRLRETDDIYELPSHFVWIVETNIEHSYCCLRWLEMKLGIFTVQVQSNEDTRESDCFIYSAYTSGSHFPDSLEIRLDSLILRQPRHRRRQQQHREHGNSTTSLSAGSPIATSLKQLDTLEKQQILQYAETMRQTKKTSTSRKMKGQTICANVNHRSHHSSSSSSSSSSDECSSDDEFSLHEIFTQDEWNTSIDWPNAEINNRLFSIPHNNTSDDIQSVSSPLGFQTWFSSKVEHGIQLWAKRQTNTQAPLLLLCEFSAHGSITAQLSAATDALLDKDSAGCSRHCQISEFVSFALIQHLLPTALYDMNEMEVEYWLPNSPRVDYTMKCEGQIIAVSVTRAWNGGVQEYTKKDAIRLLTKKLVGIQRALVHVHPSSRWQQQIIHIWSPSVQVTRLLHSCAQKILSSSVDEDHLPTLVLITNTVFEIPTNYTYIYRADRIFS